MRKVKFLTFKDENPNGIYLVTGEIGVGKSVFCKEMLASALEAGMNCGGVLSPGVFEDNIKIQLMLHDISTGEKHVFADKIIMEEEKCADLRLGQWCMSTEVLDWGNQILRNLNEGLDVVFVDELGPLEFRKGIGLTSGLDVLQEKKFDLIFAVIRPSLLEAAKQRFDVTGLIEINNQEIKIISE